MSDFPEDQELRDLAKKVVDAATAKFGELQGQSDPFTGAQNTNIDEEGNREKAEFIIERFERHLKPYPGGAFTDKIEACEAMVRKLGVTGDDMKRDVGSQFADGDLDIIETAKDSHMDKWDGVFATKFSTEYLGKFRTIAGNQGLVMAVLANDMRAMRNIYIEARKSLKKIGDQALTAIEAADGLSESTVSALLSVLGAFMGLVNVAIGAVGSKAASVAGAAVSGGISIGGGQVPDGKEMPLGGTGPEQVLDNIKKALDKLDEQVKDKEDELIKSMKESGETLDAMLRNSSSVNTRYEHSTGTDGAPNTPLIPGAPRLNIVAKQDGDLSAGLIQLN